VRHILKSRVTVGHLMGAINVVGSAGQLEGIFIRITLMAVLSRGSFKAAMIAALSFMILALTASWSLEYSPTNAVYRSIHDMYMSTCPVALSSRRFRTTSLTQPSFSLKAASEAAAPFLVVTTSEARQRPPPFGRKFPPSYFRSQVS